MDRARAILLVDDDEGLCELVQEFLGREGYDVTSMHDGASGLGAALEGGFALVILDVMLPVLDGFAVLRQLRRQSNVPVIMLTARAAEQDRIGGLGEGADDRRDSDARPGRPCGPGFGDGVFARAR